MMQRLTRRTLLAAGSAGLAVAACSSEGPLGLHRPGPVPLGPSPAPTATGGPPSRPSTVGTAGASLAHPADGYLALAPSVLGAGQTEAISLALFQGDQPASDTVSVALARGGQTVASAAARVHGHGTVSLSLPDLSEGDYQLQVSARGFQDQAPVRVESGTLVFLETDKPIYKPGQTIHFRVLVLSPALKPAGGQVTLDVIDARGIKVFRATPMVDELGMATVDLPLSTEPNLGVWKATATLGQRTAELDLRVEHYVLPKYEVTIKLKQDWALVSDPIEGTIAAEYTYGKPVDGEVEIRAVRYVGTWQEYARVSQHMVGGRLPFRIPAVQYAVGSPAGRGMSSVRLDVTVREQATGYEERASELVTVAPRPVNLTLIPESPTFKPGLPFSLLAVAETPGSQPVDGTIQFTLSYQDAHFRQVKTETRSETTTRGLARLRLTAPVDAATLYVTASAKDAAPASATLSASYSPSGSFIHVEQVSTGPLKVGDRARFSVASTRGASNVYYEVVARGQVVYSDFSPTAEIAIDLTPLMAPESRLLVYQILSNAEVAADYLPFKVTGEYPQQITLAVDQADVKPGDPVGVAVQTEGPARVGLVAVDRSVFVLSENRLNLQQVFDELERLYLKPRVELHGVQPLGFGGPLELPGAKETFRDAGLVVLTNRQVPEGQQLRPRFVNPGIDVVARAMPAAAARPGAAAPTAAPAAAPAQNAQVASSTASGRLAAVQRVRQFFPETWLWDTLTTDGRGQATRRLTAPDSITTWMFRAVGLSKDRGLGIAETQLRVFQPFFVQVDLPYSVVRGEQFPVRVALYNYQTSAQQFVVDLDQGGWFELLDVRSKTVSVDPNAVGSLSFDIRPTGLGVGALKVTARSQTAADALSKDLLVEPEGIQREVVDNVVVSPGVPRTLDLGFPVGVVQGSARAWISLTGNVLSQTIHGLDGLLQMPFGCGEQNMINFAPDVFVSRYLKATEQLTPAVMAKAELLMLTGYQRELTYRRSDGSFSAFGESDPEGSLFLTAFVLKTFAQAKSLIFIDDAVLSAARSWIRQRQNADGSFDPFGFVHHRDLLGGVNGKNPLTAYVAIALHAAGDTAAMGRAIGFLEGVLGQISDAYSTAITAYALALAGSSDARTAHDKLMALAHQSPDGLWWGDEPRPLPVPIEGGEPEPLAWPGAAPAGGVAGGPAVIPLPPRPIRPPFLRPIHTTAIETTGYAALALLRLGDKLNASRAISWLAAQRNAQGGFGSTQDTVVALEAMTTAAVSSRADVDATVSVRAGSWRKDVRVSAGNADVVQIIEVPVPEPTVGGPAPGVAVTVTARGKGQIMAQAVRRYNVLGSAAPAQSAFQIDVRYDVTTVAVNDLITITAAITFTPPEPVAAGMVVLDVSVPTGFAPVPDTLATAVRSQPKLKRYDIAGRKIILYIEDMLPHEQLSVSFQARALYPVRAQPASSQVYAYYRPDWKGESLGPAVTVAS